MARSILQAAVYIVRRHILLIRHRFLFCSPRFTILDGPLRRLSGPALTTYYDDDYYYYYYDYYTILYYDNPPFPPPLPFPLSVSPCSLSRRYSVWLHEASFFRFLSFFFFLRLKRVVELSPTLVTIFFSPGCYYTNCITSSDSYIRTSIPLSSPFSLFSSLALSWICFARDVTVCWWHRCEGY